MTRNDHHIYIYILYIVCHIPKDLISGSVVIKRPKYMLRNLECIRCRANRLLEYVFYRIFCDVVTVLDGL